MPMIGEAQDIVRLYEQYAPPEWFKFLDIMNIGDITGHLLLLEKAFSIASTVAVSTSLEKAPQNVERIFEFGSGNGEGLIVLSQFAKTVGACVVGSERYEVGTEKLQDISKHLANVDRVDKDGFKTLKSGEKFDLILANMFGPTYWFPEEFGKEFLLGAYQVLNVGGIAVINSDMLTMEQVVLLARKNPVEGVGFELLSETMFPKGLKDKLHLVIKKTD